MHPDDLQNWKTIKEAMETSGNTDNYYYKRAVMIVGGGNDPMPADPKDATELQ